MKEFTIWLDRRTWIDKYNLSEKDSQILFQKLQELENYICPMKNTLNDFSSHFTTRIQVKDEINDFNFEILKRQLPIIRAVIQNCIDKY